MAASTADASGSSTKIVPIEQDKSDRLDAGDGVMGSRIFPMLDVPHHAPSYPFLTQDGVVSLLSLSGHDTVSLLGIDGYDFVFLLGLGKDAVVSIVDLSGYGVVSMASLYLDAVYMSYVITLCLGGIVYMS